MLRKNIFQKVYIIKFFKVKTKVKELI